MAGKPCRPKKAFSWVEAAARTGNTIFLLTLSGITLVITGKCFASDTAIIFHLGPAQLWQQDPATQNDGLTLAALVHFLHLLYSQ